MGSGKAVNTHVVYQTIHHEHLDSLVYWALNGDDFPSSGLNLVECESGKWFVEVDHGTEFDNLEGISKPDVSPFVEPTFFSSEEAARVFAYDCIKTVYPNLKGKNLDDYYDED
ncbi:hypothetical protein [Vibrio mediterranei]|uniref:hypothetical protein n=1 Tax=Vibrio mediterranei TaxID=689 RepID=UPI001EFC3AD5|nr:hypothetical protein [Vibrio mediterranei]MCG9657616.1 hypothetical protein [Vibrio mediterranei]